jgi:hypothetical protein
MNGQEEVSTMRVGRHHTVDRAPYLPSIFIRTGQSGKKSVLRRGRNRGIRGSRTNDSVGRGGTQGARKGVQVKESSCHDMGPVSVQVCAWKTWKGRQPSFTSGVGSCKRKLSHNYASWLVVVPRARGRKDFGLGRGPTLVSGQRRRAMCKRPVVRW